MAQWWRTTCDTGGVGSIPGVEKIPWRDGNGNPLQYSCLENLMDKGAWCAILHAVAKSQDMTERLNNDNKVVKFGICFIYLTLHFLHSSHYLILKKWFGIIKSHFLFILTFFNVLIQNWIKCSDLFNKSYDSNNYHYLKNTTFHCTLWKANPIPWKFNWHKYSIKCLKITLNIVNKPVLSPWFFKVFI